MRGLLIVCAAAATAAGCAGKQSSLMPLGLLRELVLPLDLSILPLDSGTLLTAAEAP
ncbi:hypothetical protein PR003_g4763 [Phytophthora rubi]|uniref:RxLR effector protein n=1 Tax=Phytophthora rubi TaxID=129364 RepID=A0A6A3NKS4_9STRA|nr:hypothetical protein PR002_g4680 [Phytophthora rubi]KAE9045768.1 hypothetical protein PR001_g4837 [Phytophthora rubi]KAE9351727.1 hypothetical protein PR003_g4763 [Phytophthora rubi]